MQLTLPRADLARVIGNVARVVEARNTIDILGSLLLDATVDGDGKGKLTVTATDLDIVVTDAAEADVAAAGRICVDAKLLGEIAKKVGGDIIMKLDDGRLIVKSGRSRYVLETRDPVDFPSLDGGTFDATLDVDLAALFAPVAFAIAVKESRHYLEGIYLHVIDGKLTAVATNGHRLARHVGDEAPEFEGVIVAQKPVSIIAGVKGVARVSVSQQKLRIEAGDFIMTTKLIEGDYPDYRRVIPVGNPLTVTAEKADILKAAERVTVVSNERGNAVKMSVAPGSITMAVRGPSGEAVDEVAAEYAGEPTEIGFNSIYLRDALQVLPDGPVDIALRDSGSPAHITSPAYPALDITLMPVRVS